MKTPEIRKIDDYLLVDLPTAPLARHDVESWISKTQTICKHHNIFRILVRRKNPVIVEITHEDIARYIHLISSLNTPDLRIALVYPKDYYNEGIDQLTLSARERGLSMELFFQYEQALQWLRCSM